MKEQGNSNETDYTVMTEAARKGTLSDVHLNQLARMHKLVEVFAFNFKDFLVVIADKTLIRLQGCTG